MKQFNVLWSGREYYSLENCVIATYGPLLKVWSTIVGRYEGSIYRVGYSLSTNAKGETTSLSIEFQHNNLVTRHELLNSDEQGWKYNGRKEPQFNGCLDIDIPLTPLTNTLPINRLRLLKGEAKEIRVIYCDLLANRIHAVSQRYQRLSDTTYHYENVPNDFEADIVVDENGIVIHYPQLFDRSAIVESGYNLDSQNH